MMQKYLHGHDDEVAAFVAMLVPHCRRGFGPNIRAMGVLDDAGRLIAGIVWHNWDPDAEIIEISGAAITPRWLTRDVLFTMHNVPFMYCQSVAMRVPADNERLLRQLAEYGYAFAKVPRLFGRARDGVVATLTVEAWIANRFNKQLRARLAEMQEAA